MRLGPRTAEAVATGALPFWAVVSFSGAGSGALAFVIVDFFTTPTRFATGTCLITGLETRWAELLRRVFCLVAAAALPGSNVSQTANTNSGPKKGIDLSMYNEG